jgi:16S rRNA (guanine527-N7)-methyltransferase
VNQAEARLWFDGRVSRETMDRLEVYSSLLVRWQKTINLVAPSTLPHIWTRHFVDSAQLAEWADEKTTHWLDLGSGAGFPGLVVAVMFRQTRPDINVTLIESDVRKCGFLREAARQMDLSVTIIPERISDVSPQSADVISARALADLPTLISYAKPHMHAETQLLFSKGAGYKDELESLPTDWQTATETHISVADPSSVILRIRQPEPREAK